MFSLRLRKTGDSVALSRQIERVRLNSSTLEYFTSRPSTGWRISVRFEARFKETEFGRRMQKEGKKKKKSRGTRAAGGKEDEEEKKSVDNQRVGQVHRVSGQKANRRNGEKAGNDRAALDVWRTR